MDLAINTTHSSLSQLDLDNFCNNFGITDDFGPLLPGPNDTIRDFPPGKIGIYCRFIEFSNFRLPLSRFLLYVLEYFRIHISQLFVLGAARVSHFELMCRSFGKDPTVTLFRRFYYSGKGAGGWMTFEKRRDRKNHPVSACYEEPFDSLKGWRDRFF